MYVETIHCVTIQIMFAFIHSKMKCFGLPLDKPHFSSFQESPHFRILHFQSWTDCVYQCKIRNRCGFVNYQRRFHRCELLENSEETGAQTKKDKNYHLGRKEDWIMTEYGVCDQCGKEQVCDMTQPDPQVCKMDDIECGIPPEIEHAHALGNMNSVGSRMCNKCNAAYIATITGNVCSTCLSTGTWSSVSLNCGELLFRAEAGNGMPVYQAWSADYHNSPSDPGCRLLTKTNCVGHYRHWSMDLDKINTFLQNEKKVKVAVYKNGIEVAYVLFDVPASVTNTRSNWFKLDYLTASSWTDINSNTVYEDVFNIDGGLQLTLGRRFYISSPWKGCLTDKAWLMVKDADATNFPCKFDSQSSLPAFLYSQHTNVAQFGADDYGLAEVLAVVLMG